MIWSVRRHLAETGAVILVLLVGFVFGLLADMSTTDDQRYRSERRQHEITLAALHRERTESQTAFRALCDELKLRSVEAPSKCLQ